MQPQHTHGDAEDRGAFPAEESIDLRRLVRALLHYRWLIIVFVGLGALAGVGASLLSTKYRSQGLLLTPGLSLSNFKQYESALRNKVRLDRFLESSELEDSATGERLRTLLEKPGAWDQAVRPVFTVTGKDARDFDIRSDEPGAIVGMQLTLDSDRQPEQAPIVKLAEYLRGTMIELDVRAIALSRCIQYRSRVQQLASEQLKDAYRLEQQQARAGTLRDLIARVPGADAIDNRQVVSLENGAERFLSPVAQLVAVEVGMSEIQLAQTTRDRERVSSGLNRDYYCKVRSLVDSHPGSRSFFEQVEQVRSEVLATADGESPVVKEVSIDLLLQQQEWVDKYVELTRFVVSPAGNEKLIRRPGIVLGALLGAALALLFGAILAVMLAWWDDNRDDVLAEERAAR